MFDQKNMMIFLRLLISNYVPNGYQVFAFQEKNINFRNNNGSRKFLTVNWTTNYKTEYNRSLHLIRVFIYKCLIIDNHKSVI